MSVFSGPEVSNDGLIFYYDMNNVEKSWRGRPTTNNAANGKVDYYSRWATTNNYPPLPFSKKTDVYVLTEGNNYFGGSDSFSITNGNTYTVSYWYYIDTTETMQHFMLPLTGSYATAATTSASTFVDTNNTKNVSGNIGGWVWGYKTFTVTSAPTYMRGTYTVGGGDTTPTGKMYITNVVIESGSTPSGPYGYTGGTRSNTQALLDLSGNVTITASNLSYSSNGTFSFDGTDDYIDVASNLGTLTQYTFCHWSKRDAESRMPIGWRSGPTFYQFGDNSWYYTHGGVAAEYYYPKSVSIPLGTWGFYCITYDGTAVRIYRNSVFEGSQATTGSADWTNGVRIGYWAGGGSYWYLGTIGTVSMYNRALSAQEIALNFRATRGRYGV